MLFRYIIDIIVSEFQISKILAQNTFIEKETQTLEKKLFRTV